MKRFSKCFDEIHIWNEYDSVPWRFFPFLISLVFQEEMVILITILVVFPLSHDSHWRERERKLILFSLWIEEDRWEGTHRMIPLLNLVLLVDWQQPIWHQKNEISSTRSISLRCASCVHYNADDDAWDPSPSKSTVVTQRRDWDTVPWVPWLVVHYRLEVHLLHWISLLFHCSLLVSHLHHHLHPSSHLQLQLRDSVVLRPERAERMKIRYWLISE